MANMSFDFNQVKRSFLTIKLKEATSEEADDLERKLAEDLKKEKVILVKMPMKKTFEKLTALTEADTEKMSGSDAMDTMGALVAETMSNNIGGVKITAKFITDNYDIEELYAFIKQYMDFVSGVNANPN